MDSTIRRRDLLKFSLGAGGLTGILSNIWDDNTYAETYEKKIRGLPKLRITDIKVMPTTILGRNYVPVKVITSEPGLYGVGDASLNGRDLSVVTTLEEYFKVMLIGRDADRIEDFWQNWFRGTFWRGGPVMMSALAGIDMALWDIKGKRAGMPVYSLLGGKCREGLLIYTPASANDLATLEEYIRKKMEIGVKVFRVHPPQKPGRSQYIDEINSIQKDVPPEVKKFIPETMIWDEDDYLQAIPETFNFLEKTFSKDIKFCIDVHERVSLPGALKVVKILEQYNTFFIEDVLRPEHKESFRLIRQHSTAPLAMGEIFNTKWEFLTLITEQLIDYIRLDLAHSGGITEARKVAAIAEPYYVKSAWHGPVGYGLTPITMAANMHVDFAIPNFGIQEYVFYDSYVDEVFPNSIKFRNGYLEIGDEPGLGCDINEELLRKHPHEKAVFNNLRTPDGSVQDY